VTPEQLFEIWAPQSARWSRWAKPVLFAHAGGVPQPSPPVGIEPPPQPFDASRLPPADGAALIVVDLPGAAGIDAGVALAEAGYRPVPLYNAVPWPAGRAGLAAGAVVVDMSAVMAALHRATPRLRELRLRDDAPPAFLLDARRRVGDTAAVRPTAFDNRSVSLPTDFPSANLLLASGLRRAVVVHQAEEEPQADLGHTLRRWQEAGIQIAALVVGPLESATTVRPVTIHKPAWYRHLWHTMLVRFNLRANPLGGFGGFIPEPSSGAG
jgi:hypothetical protein